MTISELISALESAQAQYGDIDVTVFNIHRDVVVGGVEYVPEQAPHMGRYFPTPEHLEIQPRLQSL